MFISWESIKLDNFMPILMFCSIFFKHVNKFKLQILTQSNFIDSNTANEREYIPTFMCFFVLNIEGYYSNSFAAFKWGTVERCEY